MKTIFYPCIFDEIRLVAGIEIATSGNYNLFPVSYAAFCRTFIGYRKLHKEWDSSRFIVTSKPIAKFLTMTPYFPELA